MNTQSNSKFIYHRVNTLQKLQETDKNFGVEVDIRFSGKKFFLSHDCNYVDSDLYTFLSKFEHKLLVANIKVVGIEKEFIKIMEKYKIDNFFLLDVEPSFLIHNYKDYKKNLCIRYSYLETIQLAKDFIDKVDWLWIDTYNKVKLEPEIFKNFKTCLVSPSRWDKKKDIEYYKNEFTKNEFWPDFIMIEKGEEKLWNI